MLLLAVLAPGTAHAQPVPCEIDESITYDVQDPVASLEARVDDDGPSRALRLALACAYLRERDWRKADRTASSVLDDHPDDLEAHLLRGMARRELEHGLPLSWSNLREFEYVIERDSTFQDVLYEYAKALQYRGSGRQQRKALELAERQLQIKPHLLEARIGIFDLYRYFLRSKLEGDVEEWLASRRSPYARFFHAEVHRRAGRLATADSVLAILLRDDELPAIPLLLARARIRYEERRDADGQALVEQALNSIDEPLDVYLVFRDLKYVLTPAEYASFQTMSETGELRAFLWTIFEKRDPMPASRVNARLAEHYRRLVTVERSYVYFGARNTARNPDTFQRLEFPPTFELAEEFDDRGIVYLRHGEPDERVAFMGAEETGESWRYARFGLDFHFRTETSMSLRLQPLPDAALLRDIDLWDADYRRLAKDRVMYQEHLIRKSIDQVATGLATDNFSWGNEATVIDMPVLPALFRGEDGATELYAFYALPAGQLSGGTAVEVEVGISLHDTAWVPVDNAIYSKRIPSVDDPTAAAIDLIRASVKPGDYHLSLHAREPEAHRVASVKADISAPPFDSLMLAMSDVVPAFDVRPTMARGHYVRNGYELKANPVLSFGSDQPVHAYFEIYNLTYGPDERTHYSVEYRLQSHEKHGKFLGLFGGDVITIAIESEGEGTSRTAVEYGQIDVSNVPADTYELTVTVTDETIGRSVSRTQVLRLVE